MSEEVKEFYGSTEYWQPKSRPITVNVVESEPNYLKLEVEGETHTLFNMLVTELRNDEDVKFVAYKLEHPLKDKIIFVLQTKKKNPMDLIKEALKRIREKLREFKKSIEKAVDQPAKNPYFVPEKEWEEFVRENF